MADQRRENKKGLMRLTGLSDNVSASLFAWILKLVQDDAAGAKHRKLLGMFDL